MIFRRPATLRRPLGALTWVLWQYPWQPTAGSHILAVRAIDLDGNVQIAAGAPPLPDGALATTRFRCSWGDCSGRNLDAVGEQHHPQADAHRQDAVYDPEYAVTDVLEPQANHGVANA